MDAGIYTYSGAEAERTQKERNRNVCREKKRKGRKMRDRFVENLNSPQGVEE